jgi:uncharacterized protein with PIN domain
VSTKNKHKTVNLSETAERLASNIGMTAMSVAAVVSLFELTESRAQKLAPKAETGFNTIVENAESRVEELMRREKEDTAHALVSYGQTMRSHPVTGKA